jgi:two-component system, OmpR family, phosphate regulon sensor histidine kinase PhoR
MKRKKLFLQIYPSYLLITIISLFAASWYAADTTQKFFLDQTAANLEAKARLLKNQIASQVSQENGTALDALCKNIGEHLSARITVISASGKVVGDSHENSERMNNHSNRPEFIKALKGQTGRSVRYSTTLRKYMMYVAVPIEKNDTVIAVIRVSVTVNSIADQSSSVQSRIIFGSVVIALIAAGISLMVSHRILRPVRIMKQGAKQFAEGNLKYRIHVPDSEDMGKLADAMNLMAEQLDERLRDIVRQRNEYKAVFSSMSEGIIAVDRDEYVIRMNEAAARMFHVGFSEPECRSLQEIIRNPDLQRFVKKALAGENPVESDIVFYNNGEHILNTHTSPLLDIEGEGIGALVVLNDVTRLRHLETMRRDFVSDVSHEIRTPLTAIKGFVETLRGGGAIRHPDEAERFLEIIERHVNRLAAIIDDLMNLSKIEQEKEGQGIQREICAVRNILVTAVQVCQAKAREKNIVFELNCDSEITAPASPPLLEQAAVNLLDNAVKYSDRDSTVKITVSLMEREVVIAFQDHGIGIAEEHLPRVFERFYRVDKARSRKQGGTGLGLAIVKHIVQAHNGRMTVESSLGKGSLFSICLPRDLEK